MSIYSGLRSIYQKFLESKKSKYIKSLERKGLVIGKNVNIVGDFFFDPSHCFLISIGDNTTLAPNTRFIAHDASIKGHLGYSKIGTIKIGKNCFIGDSVILLPNVNVGDNVIIGAGSIVTKSIPAGHVAAGNPAKIITSLSEYLKKVEAASTTSRVFDESYYIENLDSEKKSEITKTLEKGIGYIK